MGMAEYIEREALMRRIKEIHCAECDSYHGVKCRACWVDDTLDYIDCEPAADVVHVVHAEWRLDGFCTNCGYRADVQSIGFNCTGGTRIEYKRTKFCPECGAKMDGDMENNRQAEVIR